MLEVALTTLAGAAVGGGLTAYGFVRRLSRERGGSDGPTFGEVCLAAARAKAERDDGGHPATGREFVDGADAVLGKLLEMGYGDDPLEMRLAYLAGGDSVEFDADEVTHEDLADLADHIGRESEDDARRKL